MRQRTRLLPLLLLLVTACASAPKAHPDPPRSVASGLSADEVLLIEAAAAVAQARHDVGGVWPRFWPGDQAFAMWPFRGGSLVVAPTPPIPAGSQLLADAPASLSGIAYLFPDSAAGRGHDLFDASYRVGALTVPGVGMTAAPDDRLLHQVAYLFHEAFHGYQDSVFVGRHGRDALEEPFIEPTIVADPAFRAHMGVERRLLAAALQADDPERVRSLGRDYLAVRGARLALQPARADAEELVERKEGSAHLVGNHAALIVRDGDARKLADLLLPQVLAPSFEENARVTDRYREQLYVTGAAIGVLLDRLGSPWREAMERGGSFPELLARSIGTAWPATTTVSRELLDAHGYDALLDRASRYAVEDPLAEPYEGPMVEVIGLRPDRVQSSGTTSDRPGMRVYHYGTTLTVTAADGVVETRGVVVIADRRRREGRLEIRVPRLPAVNGSVPAEGTTRRNGVAVEEDLLSLRISVPVTIQRRGETLTITVDEPGR